MTTVEELARDFEANLAKAEDVAERLRKLLATPPEERRIAEKLNESFAKQYAEDGVASASRPGKRWPMSILPDGLAVHDGEGCEAEFFRGVLNCRHSKEMSTMTTAMVKAESVLTPAPIAFNEDQLKVIKTTICKGASDNELALFVATCTRTGLDPFLGQIYAVKRYDSSEKREVMAIQVGIDGRRLIAERTDRYGGQDPIEWLNADGVWSEVWIPTGPQDTHPLAARCSVYRKDWPDHKATAVATWASYAQTFGAEKRLSPTWAKMPDVMLGKCAENLALRRAFPAEMSAVDVNVGGYDADADELHASAYVEPADVFEGEVVQPVAAPPEKPKAPAAPKPGPAAPSDHEHTPSYTLEGDMVCSVEGCGKLLDPREYEDK